jgi:hypothetical protein
VLQFTGKGDSRMILKRMTRLSSILAAATLFAAAAFAQSSSGTVSGRVVDPTGAAIAGAEVHILNQADRNLRSFNTTPAGDFAFPNLDPGDYTVTVKMAGFKGYEKRDMHLAASDALAMGEIRLEVGAVSETVEVTAQGAAVETASGERSGLLDTKQIGDLMARGRDVMSLLQILPGVEGPSEFLHGQVRHRVGRHYQPRDQERYPGLPRRRLLLQPQRGLQRQRLLQ